MVAEDLLQPNAPEAPCGEDLSYDPALQELETLSLGKPETQFSPAEPPDYKELRKHCLSLFARSKDLRVAVHLLVAELALDGLAGFQSGLLLVNGLLERYWAAFHPQLDPNDDNDPLQRMNILASLATPLGTFGDPLRVLEKLRHAPLCQSTQLGRFALADILRAESNPTSETAGASAAQIDAAFRDSDPAQLLATHQLILQSQASVQAIDAFVTRIVGPARAPDLSTLLAELNLLQSRVVVRLPAAAGTQSARPAATQESRASNASGSIVAMPGQISSRGDVVEALRRICAYYAQAEPSSPVPLLLKRAERMVEMGFMEIMTEMAADSLAQVRLVTGEPEKQE